MCVEDVLRSKDANLPEATVRRFAYAGEELKDQKHERFFFANTYCMRRRRGTHVNAMFFVLSASVLFYSRRSLTPHRLD